MDTEEVL